jgi:hypothetical protein
LAVTWWGGYGIGANDWRDAKVVLLFDDFHLPGHALIATVQGLKGHSAIEGALASLDHTHDYHPDVDALCDGHILRWLKQLALRGRARELDDNGICGEQKLVVTGDLIRLIEHFDRLFPGAKGGQRSLREISAELAARGIMNERGQPFSAASIASMLPTRRPPRATGAPA